MEKKYERVWAEISLDNIEHNYLEMKKKAGCEVAGVVKANAYGHGAKQVAQRLEKAGCRFFCVASLAEAEELRSCVSSPILILGYTPPEQTGELIEFDITQSAANLETAKAFSAEAVKLGKKMKVHIKLDTGMGRTGFNCRTDGREGLAAAAEAVRLPGLEVGGVFTHFPVSDEPDGADYTRAQYAGFAESVKKLEELCGMKFAVKHCANSGALVNCDYTYMDMVRPGIALYGCFPGSEAQGLELRPAMELKTRVIQVSGFEDGESVGYGRTWKADGRRRIAVISVGYADGFSRRFSNNGEVLIRGKRAPVVGRVCMDLAMIDVTEIKDAQIGDTVTLIGRDGGETISADEYAASAGTISYEMLCAVSARVPRYYE